MPNRDAERRGEVAELVDARGLGLRAFGRPGSSPGFPTWTTSAQDGQTLVRRKGESKEWATNRFLSRLSLTYRRQVGYTSLL